MSPTSPTSSCSRPSSSVAIRTQVAAEIGGAGGAALKRLVTEAVIERFRAIRGRRAELMRDRGDLRDVL